MNENWSKKERSGGDESEERKSFVRRAGWKREREKSKRFERASYEVQA